MNSVNIHNIEKIYIRKIRDLDGSFNVCIVIRSTHDRRTDIELFADNIEVFEPLTTEMEEELK